MPSLPSEASDPLRLVRELTRLHSHFTCKITVADRVCVKIENFDTISPIVLQDLLKILKEPA